MPRERSSHGDGKLPDHCLTVPMRVEVPAARITADVGESTRIIKIYQKSCGWKSGLFLGRDSDGTMSVSL